MDTSSHHVQHFLQTIQNLKKLKLELRAQIERAINSGLKISYLDYHMGTAVDKPELRKIVEKLAKEYGLGNFPLLWRSGS